MSTLSRMGLMGVVITTVVLSPIMFVQAAPTVSVEKTNQASVQAGAEFTYTIVVRNAGDSNADNVILRDTLDGNLTFVSSSPAPTSNTTTITNQTDLMWNLGGITPGGSATVTVTVRAPSSFSASTTLNNSAMASGSNFTTVNSNTSAILVVQPNPGFSVVKRPDSIAVNPGMTFTYQVTVTNVGGSAANNVNVHDEGMANITLLSATPSGTMNSNGTIDWNVGTLNPGQTFSATVVAKVDADAAIGSFAENQVTVTGSNAATVNAPSVNAIIGPPGTTPLPTPTPDIGVGGEGPTGDDELPRTGTGIGYTALLVAFIALLSLWLRQAIMPRRS